MKPYPDSNFLVRVCMAVEAFNDTLELLQTLPEQVVMPVTWLAELEVCNAIERYRFEAHSGSSLHISAELTAVAHTTFSEYLAARSSFARALVDASTLKAIFTNLTLRHTAKHGFRTYDILHVASALALGCDTFWSFNAKAKKLAKLEGLKTN